MSVETGAGAAILKFGLGGLAVSLISFLAVCLGFAFVPLSPGKELQDAGRRLAAGLFCSFTLGPLLASKFLEWNPGYLQYWISLLDAKEHWEILWAHLMAATPFIAVCALVGFWIVALGMKYIISKQSLREIIEDGKEIVR